MKPGELFNPYQLFRGLFVPEALARYRGVSAGAKLAYGRLARYAGQNGECYPSVPVLAHEIGVKERQARSYVAELESTGFIRRVKRFKSGAQTSNEFQFLWHSVFDNPQQSEKGEGRQPNAGGGRQDTTAGGRQDTAGKESHIEESHIEDNSDLDYLLTNRKKRASQAVASASSVCAQYPRLREELCQYMITAPDDEKICPTDRQAVEVMDAAGGASEDEVIACLRYLREERGLMPNTRNGPRSFAWFATVVQDYFSKRGKRAEAANPAGSAEWEGRKIARTLSPGRFDELTEAF